MAKHCTACGAKTVEYRHTLNALLVEGLKALGAAGGGPVNLKDLGLTRNQWDNFQKLRYWGLVERVYVDGRRQNGVWAITGRGREFLAGKVSVPRRVWTYRGEFVRYDGEPVLITDRHPRRVSQRPDYSNDAVPAP